MDEKNEHSWDCCEKLGAFSDGPFTSQGIAMKEGEMRANGRVE